MRKDSIDKIFKEGRFIRGSFIDVKVQNTKSGHISAAFIVGKKFSSNAVARNKTRRRLREALRAYIKEAGDRASGADMVFMPREEIKSKDYEAIRREVFAIVDRAISPQNII